MYTGFVFSKFKYMLLRCKRRSASTCFPALPKRHIEILCLGHFPVIAVSIAAPNYMPLYLSRPWQMGIWVVQFFSRPMRLLWLSYPRGSCGYLTHEPLRPRIDCQIVLPSGRCTSCLPPVGHKGSFAPHSCYPLVSRALL